MRVEFEDEDLLRLYTQADLQPPGLDRDVVRQFRKKVSIVQAATDERDLMAMRSLRLEKLRGKRAGQNSIRLNDQWRLILRFRTDDDGRVAVVIEMVDYH